MNETKPTASKQSQDDLQALQVERLKNGFNKIRKISFWPLVSSFSLLVIIWILPWNTGFMVPLSWIVFLFSLPAYYCTFAIKRVLEGERGVVLRLGGFYRACEPGLRLIIPLIDKMIFVDIRQQQVDIPPQDVVTKDNATVKADAFLILGVDVGEEDLDDSMKRYVFAAKDPKSIIRDLALSKINTNIGQKTYDEARQQQVDIGLSVVEAIKGDAKSWGIIVKSCMLQNIIAPPDLVEAMNKRKAATESKEAAILKAQGEAEAYRTKITVLGGGQEGLKNLVALELADKIKAGDKVVIESLGGLASIFSRKL